MKRIWFFLTMMLVVAGQSIQAQEKSTFEKILLFGAGYLSGHVVHEMGHQTAAWVTGISLKWKLEPQFPYLVYDTKVYGAFGNPHDGDWHWDHDAPTLYGMLPESRKQAIIATSGFAGESVALEIILATSSLKTDNGDYNYFLLGLLSMTIINPIANSIRDAATNVGYGDIQTVRDMGQNQRIVEAFILTHAAVTFVRVVMKLGNHGESFQISSTPTSLDVQISF